jgi:CHAD domain-containing protein
MYLLSLLKNESPKDGIKRIFYVLMDNVLSHCSDTRDIHLSIHEIRRNLKKIRAVLRMVRDEIGYAAYTRENTFFRDLGRMLSEIRSSEILHHSLELSRTRFRHKRYEPVFNQISLQILEKRDEIIRNKIEKEDVLGQIAQKIRSHKNHFDDLLLATDNYSVFLPGLTRIYRHNREYLKKYHDNPEINALHDFRKKVKYLLCQLQVIYPVFPEMLKVYISILDKIGDKLGIYRDLYELQEFIAHNFSSDINSDHMNKLNREIESIKSRHLTTAMEKSDKFFVSSTKVFVRQMEGYMNLIES